MIYKKLQGITLIEVLLYLTLFGIMFVVVMQFVITVRNGNLMAEERSDLEKTTLYLMNHMNADFSIANSVSSDSNTQYNTDNGSIRLNLPTKYVQYYVLNKALHYSNNGTDYNITNPDYYITKFYLEQILNNDGVLEGVRITMNIVSNKNNYISKSITTSFILQ